MITIWRRVDVTTMADEKPRRVWARVSDYDIALATSEAAHRRARALDRQDLHDDIRAIVREEVARAVLRVTVIPPLADEIHRAVEAAVVMAQQRVANAMRPWSDAG